MSHTVVSLHPILYAAAAQSVKASKGAEAKAYAEKQHLSALHIHTTLTVPGLE